MIKDIGRCQINELDSCPFNYDGMGCFLDNQVDLYDNDGDFPTQCPLVLFDSVTIRIKEVVHD